MKSLFSRLRGNEARGPVMEYTIIALLLIAVVVTSVPAFRH
jgi:hypothetical protein